MKRNISLDLIKIVAMYSVMALHIGFAIHIPHCFLARYWWSLFGVAVPLFFMVSGYLMESKTTVSFKYSLRKVFGILKYVFITMTPFVFYELVKGNLNGLKYYYSWIRQGSPLSIYWFFAAMIIVYLLLPSWKRLMNGKYSRLSLILLFFICQAVFVLNVLFGFEKTYTYQAFRIWNWLFYFSLGMLVKRYQDKFNGINLIHMALACMAFLVFRRVFSGLIGNEYFYCSIPNMAYVLCLFVCLYKIRLGPTGEKAISELSTLFLPVYTIHWPIFLFCMAHGIRIDLPEPNLFIIMNYLVLAIVITLFSLLLVRLPVLKTVFRL